MNITMNETEELRDTTSLAKLLSQTWRTEVEEAADQILKNMPPCGCTKMTCPLSGKGTS